MTTALSTTWWNAAVCRAEDPQLFFPVGEGPVAKKWAEKAKAVCATCPVMDECLQWALDNGQDAGIWGGLTPRELRALRRRLHRGKGRPDPAPCGTTAAYRRHMRNHEKIDFPCREANRLAQQEKKDRVKQAVIA